MRVATLAASAALFLLSLAYWFAADALPHSRLGGQVGADGLPKVLGLALGGLALVLAGQTLFDMQRARASFGARAREPKVLGDWRVHLRALGLIGLGALYILVLPHLGYLCASALLLGLVAAYAGRKPSAQVALFAVLGGVSFWVIFVKILQIPLPAGVWPRLFG